MKNDIYKIVFAILQETSALHVFLQLVAENLNTQEINICNIIENKGEENFETIKQVIDDLPEIKINLLQMCRNEVTKMSAEFFVNFDVLMITNLASDDNVSLLEYKDIIII